MIPTLPAGARVEQLPIGGWNTHIVTMGEGPPVLLVHGSSIAVDGWLTWFRLAPMLAQTHRVILYDQPGFGHSEVPADRRYLDRLERARHAAELIDALDLVGLSVIGHSEGGFVAAWLALHKPDRLSRILITTSGGTAPILGDARDAAWMAASTHVYDYPRRARSEEEFVRSDVLLERRSDPPFEALLRENFRLAMQSGNAECFLKHAAGGFGYQRYTALQESELYPYFPKLALPVLLAWAGEDETVPVERGMALARMMPGSELHVFPQAAHWLMHEAPERFGRLVENWLRD